MPLFKTKLTKQSLEKLKLLSKVVVGSYIERDVSVKHDTGSVIFKCILKDVDDDFRLPVADLSKFITIYSRLIKNNELPEISYEILEKEIGLSTKKMFIVTITNTKTKDTFILNTQPNVDIEKRQYDKTKTVKVGEDFIKLKITGEDIDDIHKAVSLIDANILTFTLKGDIVELKIINNKNPDSSVFTKELAVESASNTLEKFMLDVSNFEKLSTSPTYNVTLAKIGCEFKAVDDDLMYCFGARKT